MLASTDVVVVGSGALGASVACHLAGRGVRVAVLDRAAGPGGAPPIVPTRH